jgi:hypothetical protein
MLGDANFDILFPFKNGQFTLSQYWDEPTNTEDTAGNLLFPFYVTPFYAKLLGKSLRIETRTVWNHPDYPKIHPGGMAQLYNSNLIDGKNITFDSDATENILSDADLEERLRMRCNAPRDLADMQKLWMWREFPEYEHPHFAPKTFGMLAVEAEENENRKIDETAWENSRGEREERGRRLTFNFSRLNECIKEVLSAYDIDGTVMDIFARARQLHTRDTAAAIERVSSVLKFQRSEEEKEKEKEKYATS